MEERYKPQSYRVALFNQAITFTSSSFTGVTYSWLKLHRMSWKSSKKKHYIPRIATYRVASLLKTFVWLYP